MTDVSEAVSTKWQAFLHLRRSESSEYRFLTYSVDGIHALCCRSLRRWPVAGAEIGLMKCNRKDGPCADGQARAGRKGREQQWALWTDSSGSREPPPPLS